KFAPRVGKRLDGVSRETMQRLQEYPWPGNIRELENVLERAVILTTDAMLEIAPDLLHTPVAAATTEERPNPADRTSTSTTSVPPPTAGQSQPTLQDVERHYILTILEQTNWLITGPRGAAKFLGLHPSTLRNRMKKLGITRSPR